MLIGMILIDAYQNFFTSCFFVLAKKEVDKKLSVIFMSKNYNQYLQPNKKYYEYIC